MLINGAAHGFVRGKSIVTMPKIISTVSSSSKWILRTFPLLAGDGSKAYFVQAGYPEQIATLFAMLCTESPRQLVKQGNVIYYGTR